jgi:hypothetical protein
VVAGICQHATLDDGLSQLLDEQRYPVCPVDDLVDDLLR